MQQILALPLSNSFILGISGFFHDSAACLLRNGEIVAAAQEERFSRIKGDASFPAAAVAFCLRSAGISERDLDAVVFYEKPLLKFERILENYLDIAPAGFRSFLKAGPLWIKDRLYVEDAIRKKLNGYSGLMLFAEHHESHAASAFYPSPFQEAAILTVDGVGEWATATIGRGQDSSISLLTELKWPDSLGLLYSAFTYHCGFKVNSGEYKLMGLAPYGTPKYADAIYNNVLDLRSDGSFKLDQRYFDYRGGLTMTSRLFSEEFGGPPREPESPLTQREMDLASSVQAVCEEIVLRMAHTAHRQSGSPNLCMAGGVALNAVANGRILREGPFERVWIQPAAGDAGGAIGAALLAWHRYFGHPRTADDSHDSMRGAYLGPSFSDEAIERRLRGAHAVFTRPEASRLIEEVARLLAEGRVVGWFDGAMEFGPRALGARSILADPRNPGMQAQLNLKIKFREGFRPFAPSVLAERASEYFDLDVPSPYMLIVAPVQERRRIASSGADGDDAKWGIERLNVPRSDIPAVTHLDYSARLQTVERDQNPRFHALLAEFDRQTGCAVLVNTSFNVRGEPIVCTPEDAYRCFMKTNLDYLVVGGFLLAKENQRALPGSRYSNLDRQNEEDRCDPLALD